MKIFVCEAGVSMRVSERWKNLMQSKIEGESDRRIINNRTSDRRKITVS